jgi:hypothetical protein
MILYVRDLVKGLRIKTSVAVVGFKHELVSPLMEDSARIVISIQRQRPPALGFQHGADYTGLPPKKKCKAKRSVRTAATHLLPLVDGPRGGDLG